MRVVRIALAAAAVSVALISGVSAQTDAEKTDRTIPACIKAAQLREYFDLAREARRFSVQRKDYQGACVGACSATDIMTKIEPAAAQCERLAQSPWMKDWSARLKSGSAALLPDLKQLAGSACSLRCIGCSVECPPNLPDINRTAAGVAAGYRLKKMGEPTAEDVEQAYESIVTEQAPGQVKMSPAQYKEEIYACISDNLENVLETFTKTGGTPGSSLVMSVAACMDILRKKAGVPALTPATDSCSFIDAVVKEFRALVNELRYTTKGRDKNGMCASACMTIEAIGRTKSGAVACQQKASDKLQRALGSGLLEVHARWLPDAQRAQKEQCRAGCPRALPTIDKTAGGIAALIREAGIGDISAY